VTEVKSRQALAIAPQLKLVKVWKDLREGRGQ